MMNISIKQPDTNEEQQDVVTKDKKRGKLRAKKAHYLKRRMAQMEG